LLTQFAVEGVSIILGWVAVAGFIQFVERGFSRKRKRREMAEFPVPLTFELPHLHIKE